MSAGNFDCANLLESKVMLDTIWKDSAVNTDYIAEVEALRVVQANQRGMSFPDLTDPKKDRTYKAIWLTDCATDEVEDCTTQCEIGGEEIGDNCKDFQLTRCKQIEWKIARKRYRTSMWSPEEVNARAMLSKMKQIDEYLVQDFVSILDAKATANQYVPTPFTTDGNDTVIPASYWTPNLFGYMAEAAIKNRMRDAYFLSGSNMFQANWNAEQESGNAQGGQANVRKMSTFQKYFDLWNLDSVLGEKKSFLIRPSAIAFVSKHYHENSVPTPVGGNTGLDLYNVQSKNLPFITYDVIHTVVCENNEFYDKYRLEVHYDVLENPSNCLGLYNGILAFKCAA